MFLFNLSLSLLILTYLIYIKLCYYFLFRHYPGSLFDLSRQLVRCCLQTKSSTCCMTLQLMPKEEPTAACTTGSADCFQTQRTANPILGSAFL